MEHTHSISHRAWQRVLALALAAVIALGALPLGASAADPTTATATSTTTAATSAEVSGITMALDFLEVENYELAFAGGEITENPTMTKGIVGTSFANAIFVGAYILVGGDATQSYKLTSLETKEDGKVYYTIDTGETAAASGSVQLASVKGDTDRLVFSYFSNENERHPIKYTFSNLSADLSALGGHAEVTKKAETIVDGQTVYFQVRRAAGTKLTVTTNNGTVSAYGTSNQDGVFVDTYKLSGTTGNNSEITITITESWRYATTSTGWPSYSTSLSLSTVSVQKTSVGIGRYRIPYVMVNSTKVLGKDESNSAMYFKGNGYLNIGVSAGALSYTINTSSSTTALPKLTYYSIAQSHSNNYTGNVWQQSLATIKVQAGTNGPVEAVAVPGQLVVGATATTTLQKGEAYGTKVTVKVEALESSEVGLKQNARYTITFENVHTPLNITLVYAPMGVQSTMWLSNDIGVDPEFYLKPDWTSSPMYGIAYWETLSPGNYYYAKNSGTGSNYAVRWKNEQGYYKSTLTASQNQTTKTYSPTLGTDGYYTTSILTLNKDYGTTLSFSSSLIKYKVEYDANGGTYATGKEPVDNNTYDAALNRKIVVDQSRPSLADSIFTGYIIEGEKTGHVFQPGDLNDIIDLTNTGQVDLSGLPIAADGTTTLKLVAQWRTVTYNSSTTAVKVEINTRQETGNSQTTNEVFVVAPESQYLLTEYPLGYDGTGNPTYETIQDSEYYNYKWVLTENSSLDGTAGKTGEAAKTVTLTYEHPAAVSYTMDESVVVADAGSSNITATEYSKDVTWPLVGRTNAFTTVTLSDVQLKKNVTPVRKTEKSTTDPDTGVTTKTITETMADGTTIEMVVTTTPVSDQPTVQSDEIAVQSEDATPVTEEPQSGDGDAVAEEEQTQEEAGGVNLLRTTRTASAITTLAANSRQNMRIVMLDTTTPDAALDKDTVVTTTDMTTTSYEHIGWVDTTTGQTYTLGQTNVTVPWNGLSLQPLWKTTITKVTGTEVVQIEAVDVTLSYEEAYKLLSEYETSKSFSALLAAAQAKGYKWTLDTPLDPNNLEEALKNITRPTDATKLTDLNLIFDNTANGTVTDDAAQFPTTKTALPSDGGTYTVDIAEQDDADTVRKADGAFRRVTYTVLKRPPAPEAQVTASDVTIYASQAKQIANGTVTYLYPDTATGSKTALEFMVERANAKAWPDGYPDYLLDFESLATSDDFSDTPGQYTATLTTKTTDLTGLNGQYTINEVEKIVQVLVKPDPIVEAISANDITLTFEEAWNLVNNTNPVDLRTKANAKATATNQVTGDVEELPTTDITVKETTLPTDPNALTAGTYTVTFTLPSGVTETRTITVEAEPNKPYVAAKPFELTLAEAKSIQDAVAAGNTDDAEIMKLLRERAEAVGKKVSQFTNKEQYDYDFSNITYELIQAKPGEEFEVGIFWKDPKDNNADYVDKVKATILGESLEANDFTLSLVQAQDIQDGKITGDALKELLLQAAGAKATAEQTDDSWIDTDLTVTGGDSIQAVAGSQYQITFTTAGGTSKTVTLTVLDAAVSASDFKLSLEDAQKIAAEKDPDKIRDMLIAAAGASAAGKMPNGTTVNVPITSVTQAIQAVPGQTFAVTFDTGSGAAKTVNVTILGEAVKAENFTLTLAQAQEIEASTDTAKVNAILIAAAKAAGLAPQADGSDKAIDIVEVKQAIKAVLGQTFEVTFLTANGGTKTVTVTILDEATVSTEVTPSATTPATPTTPAAPSATVAPDAPADTPAESTTGGAAGSSTLPQQTENSTEALASGRTQVWALCNLILMVITFLGSAILVLGSVNRSSRSLRLASILPAIGAVVTFLLTEDIRNQMVLIDNWTLLMAGFTLVQAVLALLAVKRQQEDEDDDWEYV